jgi:hypothetical protein
MYQDIVLLGQLKILDNHPRINFDGTQFDFTKRFLESKNLNIDILGRVLS